MIEYRSNVVDISGRNFWEYDDVAQVRKVGLEICGGQSDIHNSMEHLKSVLEVEWNPLNLLKSTVGSKRCLVSINLFHFVMPIATFCDKIWKLDCVSQRVNILVHVWRWARCFKVHRVQHFENRSRSGVNHLPSGRKLLRAVIGSGLVRSVSQQALARCLVSGEPLILVQHCIALNKKDAG